MAARRGKSQARRNSGNSGGLPGWAWLILGIVIALLAVLTLPRLLKPDGRDGFILPRANPDAQPASSSNAGDDADLPTPVATAPKPDAKAADDQERQYDFYTVLPGQEVAMSDAELAASARAEAARKQLLADQQQAAAAVAAVRAADAGATPAPVAEAPSEPKPATTPLATTTAAAGTGQDNQAPYILQAGAFGASGDAEAVKARIALLGLNARVESASINGKTVYRVRMGPYGTATELAAAKGKLANGGLPAMAIKAK
ncbi:MAG: SPOR domain-containing protein [Luteimonas sp.]|nr:SPOR domain-containing protein [Luteimonas sp.]